MGFEGAGLGMIGLLVYFQLARYCMAGVIYWIGTTFEFIEILLFHATTVDIRRVMLHTIVITLLTLLVTVRLQLRYGSRSATKIAWKYRKY